jgi:hypothetical protein
MKNKMTFEEAKSQLQAAISGHNAKYWAYTDAVKTILDALNQEPPSVSQLAPVVSFFRDGIEAAAKWIDQQRESFDNDHGRYDLSTGTFEFGNEAQADYSNTLAELAEGVRVLHPNARPERDQVRLEHAQWSQATFGNVGPVGPLKHLSKEAMEAAAKPNDLSEWADMQFLLWDAQRRAGITDEQITQAMIEKLEVNKARQWPQPKDGEPRLHIKEQSQPPAPEA